MPCQTGDVVYAMFPYQEADESKDRPTLVLVADLPADNALVCMITKQFHRFDTCLEITKADLDYGDMDHSPSYVRPYRVATIPATGIRRRLGQAKPEFVQRIKEMWRRRLE